MLLTPLKSQFFAQRIASPLASGFGPKRIAAMMRVKNEEQFLEPSIESILPAVDEIVVVDNASTDRTLDIASRLAAKHPEKIRVYRYDHEIARVGEENKALAATAAGRRSPRLLANYYNWCLRHCRSNLVLKWDGDMVAMQELHEELGRFRHSKAVMLGLFGANLHPDGTHLVAAPVVLQEEIQEGMAKRMSVENWTSPYTDVEMRIFPRFRARYQNDFWWCESLYTPFARWPQLVTNMVECSYVHLKYCKRDPLSNFSKNFADLIARGVRPGPEIPDGVRKCVQQYLKHE